MLSIERDFKYKNRYLLSGLAVFAGLLITVGIIRAAHPTDNSTNQFVQTKSERRAKSIVPSEASDLEKAAENDKKITHQAVLP